MNWINIDNDKPPLNTKVLVTDGEGLFWVAERWIQETKGKKEFFKSVICTCCNQEYEYATPKYWSFIQFNQPERSKRDDSHCHNCFEIEKAIGNCFSQDGICAKCGRYVRCGALNTDESQ
jgi:hypothetical protein